MSSWESVVWGSWVGSLEFGSSQLALPHDSPHIEFHLVTGKEGTRVGLYWGTGMYYIGMR